jgi:hypothetical protein
MFTLLAMWLLAPVFACALLLIVGLWLLKNAPAIVATYEGLSQVDKSHLNSWTKFFIRHYLRHRAEAARKGNRKAAARMFDEAASQF